MSIRGFQAMFVEMDPSVQVAGDAECATAGAELVGAPLGKAILFRGRGVGRDQISSNMARMVMSNVSAV